MIMSETDQVNRNQEIWDNIQYLQRKIVEIEAILQQWYEEGYEDEDLE